MSHVASNGLISLWNSMRSKFLYFHSISCYSIGSPSHMSYHHERGRENDTIQSNQVRMVQLVHDVHFLDEVFECSGHAQYVVLEYFDSDGNLGTE